MDETLHGLIQDVEGGYIHSLAFVSPGRMAWPLPLYELALMTAARAYDMGIELSATIVTPEDAPLAIFGSAASDAVSELLENGGHRDDQLRLRGDASAGEVVINPGDRRLQVDRVIALPELYGPPFRGIPLGEHGFIRVDPHGQVPRRGADLRGRRRDRLPRQARRLAAQQADTAAQSIAALAGAPVTPEPFHPVIHGMLLTGGKPLYLTAQITGGHGFSSEVSDTPDLVARRARSSRSTSARTSTAHETEGAVK